MQPRVSFQLTVLPHSFAYPNGASFPCSFTSASEKGIPPIRSLLHLLLCNDKPINSRSSEGVQVLGAARLLLGMYSSTLGTFLGEFGLGDIAKHDACNLIGSALDEVVAAPLYKGLGFRNIRILTSHILVYCCFVKLTLDRIRSTHSFIWCLETFESSHFQATPSYTAILSSWVKSIDQRSGGGNCPFIYRVEANTILKVSFGKSLVEN
jgi:hypothetical protein